MDLSELFSAVGAAIPANTAGRVVTELVYDSRLAHDACAFFCLVGEKNDGHDFAAAAYARGARVFVVERAVDLPCDACLCVVPDTRHALADASAVFYRHPEREMTLVAITGTKGKTTGALLLRQTLRELGEDCGYIGSNGVDFADVHHATSNTTPECREIYRYLREMRDAGVRVAVLEVSSQALYKERVRGLRFDVCCFTNLAPDHIGAGEHPTFEHYAASKASLFARYGATSVLTNADDPYAGRMLADCPCTDRYTFATEEAGDFCARDVSLIRDPAHPGITYTLTARGVRVPVTLPMPGLFNVSNSLLSAGCAYLLIRKYGICKDHTSDSDEKLLASIAGALARVRVGGRFELLTPLPDRSVVIDYAHNGFSLDVVLRTLRAYEPRRLVCLFGSVGGRTKGRRAELGDVASHLADLCILTSDNPDDEDADAILDDIAAACTGPARVVRIPDRAEAIRYAILHSLPGDILLLAGKGHEDYQLIHGEKRPFCERELVARYADEYRLTSASAVK